MKKQIAFVIIGAIAIYAIAMKCVDATKRNSSIDKRYARLVCQNESRQFWNSVESKEWIAWLESALKSKLPYLNKDNSNAKQILHMLVEIDKMNTTVKAMDSDSLPMVKIGSSPIYDELCKIEIEDNRYSRLYAEAEHMHLTWQWATSTKKITNLVLYINECPEENKAVGNVHGHVYLPFPNGLTQDNMVKLDNMEPAY